MLSTWIRKPHATKENNPIFCFLVKSIHRHVLVENGCSYNYGSVGLKITAYEREWVLTLERS